MTIIHHTAPAGLRLRSHAFISECRAHVRRGVIGVLLCGPAALAQPVVNPANGHAYEAISHEMTWEQARTAAAERTFRTVVGHLATVTGSAEDAFLLATFGARDSFALGGVQVGGPEPDGGWTWITGEAWDYTDWDAGEPNNVLIHGQREDRLAWKTGTIGRWNDVAGDVNEGPGPGQYRMNGYFVEFELSLCAADFNSDGFVNSGDFFDFLTLFFAGDFGADLNRDGFINSQDFFDFLAAFFTGC